MFGHKHRYVLYDSSVTSDYINFEYHCDDCGAIKTITVNPKHPFEVEM